MSGKENESASGLRLRMGSTRAPEAAQAAAEIGAALRQPDLGLVILFVASTYDLDALAMHLRDQFGRVPVIGCTTAGEIGPGGYEEESLAGVSLAKGDLAFEVGLLPGLSGFQPRDGQQFAASLRQRLLARVPGLAAENAFAFMLIDGLCAREEVVTRAFHDGLGGIALVGGSAGDNLSFRRTFVLHEGRFVSDAATLLVATTPHPFAVFKTQHFVCGSERMVVTRAVRENRVVQEINGCPAAEEYARVVGVAVDTMDPMIFAAHPVVVRIGDADFVRSIQKVNADGSLTFFCAIDEGIVFRVASGIDLVDNLRATLADLHERIGPPRLILGCDCILRHLETKQRGSRDEVGRLLAGANVVGFSTYGEQFRGMHINQTFTGIAFGGGDPA